MVEIIMVLTGLLLGFGFVLTAKTVHMLLHKDKYEATDALTNQLYALAFIVAARFLSDLAGYWKN